MIPKVDNWRCGGCDGAEYEHTEHVNVMGYGNNLVRCVACGLKSYDWEPVITKTGKVWSTEMINNSPAAWERAERTHRTGAMNAYDEDPEAVAKLTRGRRGYYTLMVEKLSEVVIGEMKSMYEVGTDLAEFLDVAREWGVERVTGCEPNRRAGEIAKEKYGIDVENTYFGKADGVRATEWDAVAMLDVIEHTETPRRDLEKAFRNLRPGGGLILKTFYDEYHETLDLFIKDHSAWKDPNHGYFGPGHRFHFDQRVLLDLIKRVGFEIVDTTLNTVHGQITVYARKPCA